MINHLSSKLNKVENGYDPVSTSYAQLYYERKNATQINVEIDNLEKIIGSIKGKSLLDLGGGPGYYASHFAKRGAIVTWADISKNYLDIAKKEAELENVNIYFQLCYLDDFKGNYDIIFNRICFYYCMDDNSFAKKIFNQLNKGGFAYILFHNQNRLYNQTDSFAKKYIAKFKFFLNEKFSLKIGHPPISKNKMNKIFLKFKPNYIKFYDSGIDTLMIFKK